jgi:hypothetical protein
MESGFYEHQCWKDPLILTLFWGFESAYHGEKINHFRVIDRVLNGEARQL